MQADGHETMRHGIDKTLAGEASPQEEQALREHLRDCAACQEYLNASTRVIASLSEFSFEVDPGLQARVCASLQMRAQQLEAKQPSRRRMLWGCVAALMLTAIGSFVAAQFGGLAAAAFHIEPAQVQFGLVAFWIAPSLCFCLLLLLLPIFPTGWMHTKGWSL
ncbi:MAG TPA: zf-HC2 domain-containing protein [Acidobacteriaceae bacterium]|nr:zf-HC2 domain-containing protein [Acidobacteriaceae bacterium]